MVSPRSLYPTSNSTIKGSFLFDSVDDVLSILIGDSLCDRFNLERAETDTVIGLQDSEIRCQVSADMVAGYYSAKLKTLDGWTRSLASTPSVRLDTGE